MIIPEDEKTFHRFFLQKHPFLLYFQAKKHPFPLPSSDKVYNKCVVETDYNDSILQIITLIRPRHLIITHIPLTMYMYVLTIPQVYQCVKMSPFHVYVYANFG